MRGTTDDACDTAREFWATLPGKCLLAQALIHQQERSFTFGCPRCLRGQVTRSVQHDWTPDRGRQTLVRVFCDYCGLDHTQTFGVMSAR